ncbi:DUF1501 domain-containing protein [Neolewinella agarilytica]|uniref:Tat (Twin-arginine translocation) pathway signal sequence n=1 Tax=Neolewinella agarilytica TaxID=478744 RepID=A0A1H9K586_9BACT|nr:DUF1501 domain-containing protein [Neolewinella agarilytica]SEQ94269.1 Protein of unknown function [Neolewinella agarilytica]
MKINEEAHYRNAQLNSRRLFLRNGALALGGAALAGLSGCSSSTGSTEGTVPESMRQAMRYAPRAKRVIYLHMAGAPSQLELFDYKPKLEELHGKDCPASLLAGKRFAFIQGTPLMLGPQANFAQHGQSGAWVSDLLPHFSKVVDEVAFLKAVHTDEFNHAPAQLLMHTGSPRVGRPAFGSWVTYGLGSVNDNLPGFIVLASGGQLPSGGKKLWGSGFLPSIHQGVQCRSEGDPILYLGDPKGISRDLRGRSIAAINEINQRQYEEVGDPETLTRIRQYEMAFKMQVSVPEVMDISKEPDYIHALYGSQPGGSGFANDCLLARRLVESGVRFVQLYNWGWDDHGTNKGASLNHGLRDRCRRIDRPMTALLTDLKQRGMLEDTLVVWGGEFGRTPMQENRGGVTMPFYGRDHHGAAYTMWMAGGGVRPGITYGETDEIGFYGVKDRMHVHDVQATMLKLLGFDHERLTYSFQGRNFRLTDVAGEVVDGLVL